MNRLLFCLVILLSSATIYAQDQAVQQLKKEATRTIKKDAAADTLPSLWRKGGIISLGVSQGSLTNWASGGDEFSLTVNSLVSLYAFMKNGRHSWDNTMDVNYGFIRATSLGTRKLDDRFDVFTKYGYSISEKWSVAALANFRTQFLRGYTYEDDVRTLVSDFLSPAYLLYGVGMDYKPNKYFSVFLSPLTARTIFVQNETLSAKGSYGLEPGENRKFELGAFLSANYLKAFNKVLAYKGRLDLYSNYMHNPQNIDIFLTNLLSIKFTRLLSATWNVDLIYDDDIKLFGEKNQSPATQIKSLVGVGLLLKMGDSNKKP